MNLLLRLKYLQRSLVICFLASIALSWRLWFSTRNFPDLPLIGAFENIPFWLTISGSSLLCVALATLFFSFRSHFVYWCVFFSLVFLLMLDLNRIQVWTYFFGLSLVILSGFPRLMNKYEKAETLIPAFQLMFLGAYFWIGVNKMNLGFFDYVVPYVTAPLQHQFTWFLYFEELIYPVPFIQIIAIPLLVWKKSRRFTVILMMLFHLATIALIGLFSYNGNNVIIPLNLFFICSLFFLFYHKDSLSFRFLLLYPKRVKLVLIAVCLLPSLSWISPYPHNLSLDIYSGRYSMDPLEFEYGELKQIPSYLDKHSTRYGSTISVDIYRWSMEEINIPPFYESYVLDQFKMDIVKQCDRNSADAENLQ